MKVDISEIRDTANTIARDLEWTKAFYFILFKIRAPLYRIKAFRIKYPTLFEYSGWALDIAAIATLYKPFDKSNATGLRKLIDQIKHLEIKDQVQIKKSKYESFLKAIPNYKLEIDSIKKEIGDLRNKFRMHNIKGLKIKKKYNWHNIEIWIKKAENILNDALDAAGEPSQGFIAEDDLKDEQKILFYEIDKHSEEQIEDDKISRRPI